MGSNAGQYLAAGTRIWLADVGAYGTIARTNVLGCKVSPFVTLQLDDGSYRGYAGAYALQMAVDAASGSNGVGEAWDALPLDVKMVGYRVLSSMGFPTDQQVALMYNWVALPSASQAAYVSAWAAVDQSNLASVQGYASNLVGALVAAGPCNLPPS